MGWLGCSVCSSLFLTSWFLYQVVQYHYWRCDLCQDTIRFFEANVENKAKGTLLDFWCEKNPFFRSEFQMNQQYGVFLWCRLGLEMGHRVDTGHCPDDKGSLLQCWRSLSTTKRLESSQTEMFRNAWSVQCIEVGSRQWIWISMVSRAGRLTPLSDYMSSALQGRFPLSLLLLPSFTLSSSPFPHFVNPFSFFLSLCTSFSFVLNLSCLCVCVVFLRI